MYTHIPELHKNDIRLTPVEGELIWIGVSDDDTPTPIDRTNAKNFKHCYIYLYKGRLVFELITDYKTDNREYYYIPDEDLFRIEKDHYGIRFTQDMQ